MEGGPNSFIKWAIPENRALAKRELLFGLPLMPATLLVTASLTFILYFHYIITGIAIFLIGWLGGRSITRADPFALGLLTKAWRIPKILRPS